VTEHEGRVEWRELKPEKVEALDLSDAVVFAEAGKDVGESGRWFVKDGRVYVEYPGQRVRLSVLHPSNLAEWPNFTKVPTGDH
jgi:hypothetical protein